MKKKIARVIDRCRNCEDCREIAYKADPPYDGITWMGGSVYCIKDKENLRLIPREVAKSGATKAFPDFCPLKDYEDGGAK